MQRHHRGLLASGIVMLGTSLACLTPVFAAKPVELKFQSAQVLQSFSSLANTSINFKHVNANTDQQHVTHVRMQEMYAGYPVWGAVAIVHTTPESKTKTSIKELATDSKATVNGVIYQDLNKDLKETPAYVFSATQAKEALEKAVLIYSQSHGAKLNISEKKSELMVYIDDNQKAHWAFLVSFEVQPNKGMLERPSYIMDAMAFNVYREWNDIKKLSDTLGGGFGGNLKMGKLAYDSLSGNLPKLTIQRDAELNLCYLSNSNVTVRHYRTNKMIQFNCEAVDADHDNVYWNADFDAVNDGYSPSNDALYAGQLSKTCITSGMACKY